MNGVIRVISATFLLSFYSVSLKHYKKYLLKIHNCPKISISPSALYILPLCILLTVSFFFTASHSRKS